MKTIEYMGQEFAISDFLYDRINFVVADSDGEVFGYVKEPTIPQFRVGVEYSYNNGDHYYIGDLTHNINLIKKLIK